MRIAIDGQALALGSHSGVPRCFVELVRGLHDLGEDVKIFAPSYLNTFMDTLPPSVVCGKRLSRAPESKFSIRALVITNHLRARGTIKSWGAKVIHHTHWGFMKGGKAQRILTVHDVAFDPDGWYAHRARQMAMDRADHIICVSACTKRDVLEVFDILPDKISIVHHGYQDFSRLGTPGGALGTARPYLLYVGTRRPYKNFWRFLEAVAVSERLTGNFDVVAFGRLPFSADEKKRIVSFGLRPDRVRQVGGEDDLLADYYKNAAAFVFPTLAEGFGLTSLEAMSCGCPVVASNASVMPEVIGDAAEFFDPYQVDDIRRAIEAVVYSDTRKEELRKLGYERLKYFSWEKCARETLAVYKSVT